METVQQELASVSEVYFLWLPSGTRLIEMSDAMVIGHLEAPNHIIVYLHTKSFTENCWDTSVMKGITIHCLVSLACVLMIYLCTIG